MSEKEKSELKEYIENLERRTELLEEKVREVKRYDDEIKEVRVVGLDFKDKCASGVEMINSLLKNKFEIYWKVSNENGFVVTMARWGLKNND